MSTNGNGHREALHFHKIPERVVSLVPSMTESLFELGLGEYVVGITDYCVYPEGELTGVPRLGGTKDPRVTDILELKPELVLANWEENTRGTVESLEAEGVPVWVTFPGTVRAALDVLWTLVGLFKSRMAAIRLETLELTLDWEASAVEETGKRPYFCPIWFDRTKSGQLWWMTFNHQTYTHDLLNHLGFKNVFADRKRRYPLDADLGLTRAVDPGDRDTRYPRVALEEIKASSPEMIILPDEPFVFDETFQRQLEDLLVDTPAVQCGCVRRVDGSLLTWHGTRLARAIRELPALLAD